MTPSPADLHYFVEVTKTLNFSRAAERIGIRQPSLTMAIRRLEECVGAELFLRHKKGVTLTRQGRELLLHVGRLIEGWDGIKSQISKSMTEVEGTFVLGCHPSVALYSLAKFLPVVMTQHPRLDIQLRHDLSRKIAEDIISCRVDIGIVVNPVKHPDLVIHRLCYDQVTLWHAEKLRITDEAHVAKNILICDPNLLQSQEIIKKFSRKNFQFRRVLSTSSLEIVADLTAHGGGIGLLPGRVACQSPSKKLHRVEGAPSVSDEICVVYRVENRGVKALQAISDAIRQAFREE